MSPAPQGRGEGCGAYEELAADVRVRARGGVIAVQAESAVVLVLAIVAADVQHNARGIVVAVVVARTEEPP